MCVFFSKKADNCSFRLVVSGTNQGSTRILLISNSSFDIDFFKRSLICKIPIKLSLSFFQIGTLVYGFSNIKDKTLL